MSTLPIPESHRDLLEGPICATVVTLMPDGHPQASVVWTSVEENGEIWFNTARGRQKDKNLSARPQITLLAIDPENALRYIEVRGTCTEIVEDSDHAHLNKATKLYTGHETFFGNIAPLEDKDKSIRIICKIRPFKFNAYG